MALELPLPFIGWLFTIGSVLALAVGGMLIIALHRGDQRSRGVLAQTAWNDMALFGIWVLGLAGGIGVLQLRPWGRHLLEFFCWTLIALVVLSSATRLYAYKRLPPEERVSWVGAISGVALVLIPVLAICGATIVTLRSEATRAAFGG
jgi:hypothetical protein